MWSYGLSFLAGTITFLSPCVLPVLPILVGSAGRQHRLGPVALAAGLVASFVTVGMLVTSVGMAIGLDGSGVRKVAAAFLLIMGLILLSSRMQGRFSQAMAPLASAADRLIQQRFFAGLQGQFVVGSLLGAVWSPCTGPTLGAAIGLAAQSGGQAQAAATMTLFGLGASAPMLALAYGAQSVLSRHRSRLLGAGSAAKTGMGLVLILVGAAVLAGIDKKIEALLLQSLPSGWIDLITRI
jgi:cytochrome c-type biogenesis protein